MGRLVVPSLKRRSTWWAGRLNAAALKWDPPSDAAQRLALHRPAIIIFFFLSPGGGSSIGWHALAAATAALPPYMCGSQTPSCLLLSCTPFEPLLWSWQDRRQRARLVCSEAHWLVNLDTTPLSNLVFDFSWNCPLSSPPATSFPSPP